MPPCTIVVLLLLPSSTAASKHLFHIYFRTLCSSVAHITRTLGTVFPALRTELLSFTTGPLHQNRERPLPCLIYAMFYLPLERAQRAAYGRPRSAALYIIRREVPSPSSRKKCAMLMNSLEKNTQNTGTTTRMSRQPWRQPEKKCYCAEAAAPIMSLTPSTSFLVSEIISNGSVRSAGFPFFAKLSIFPAVASQSSSKVVGGRRSIMNVGSGPDPSRTLEAGKVRYVRWNRARVQRDTGGGVGDKEKRASPRPMFYCCNNVFDAAEKVDAVSKWFVPNRRCDCSGGRRQWRT